jgi:hypothetical protein
MNKQNPGEHIAVPFREVSLKAVAKYLVCKPQRLAIALKHLAETPSFIDYGMGMAACITPTEIMISLSPVGEVMALEERLKKPDKRSA